MKGFLEHIIDSINPNDLPNLRDRCYVFPTKRGGLHFQHLLLNRFASKTFIAPQILSIEEFIEEQCQEIVIADELTLLFKLYDIYKKEEPQLSFENFFVWGQTILRDFDEIDRYLLDGDKVYQNLHEIKELEVAFGPNEEMLKAHLEFQKVIEVSQGADLYKKFLKNWLIVGKVRPDFISVLQQEGIGYAGMCYRIVAERMQNGVTETGYASVCFAGFNALSKSEELIIKHLLEKNQAQVFFDIDSFYMDNEAEEAGKFLRVYKRHWKYPGISWIDSKGFQQEKSIQILGTSQQVVQSREAGKLPATATNSAVVLGDESLLMSVLYSLPTDQELNITMGYPIMSSTVGGFILAYIRFQTAVANGSRISDNPLLEREATSGLLYQSFLQSILPQSWKIDGKSKWLTHATLLEVISKDEEKALINSVVEVQQSALDILDRLEFLVLSLFHVNKDKNDKQVIVLEKIVAQVLKYLQNLRFMISTYQPKISISTLEKVVRETLKSQKVPFSGEPLVGTQVMGFLETRTLDFDNLIVLSVNEGTLPSTSTGKSYLPFGLRKAFGLPTFIEQNSIYAYHFFRLLQRAKNITLLYNSQLAFDGSGEQSRFILQLVDRLKKQSIIKLTQKQIITPISESLAEEEIQIEKTGKVLEQLNMHQQKLSEKYLSPTALVQYVECSLKYYFSKILDIKAEDKPSEDIDAREFGNILHDLMEKVYTPHLGNEIDRNEILRLSKDALPKLIEEAFVEYQSGAKETGEISFVRHVITHLANKIMDLDASEAPLKIEDLESRNEKLDRRITLEDGRSLRLSGKIDRLDAVKLEDSWLYRILDYKTGKFALGKAKKQYKVLSDEEYVDQYFTNPDFKAGFQTYFYALLYARKYPDRQVTGGILGAKSLTDGVAYLKSEKHPISPVILDLFEEKLVGTIEELFDESVPFKQTEDIDRCRFCDFSSICRR